MSSLSTRHRSRILLPAALTLGLLLSACEMLQTLPDSDPSHRYFLELDQPPGRVYSTLSTRGPRATGAYVHLLEIDHERRPLGDTLLAWVQHVGEQDRLAPEARSADIVIACHRERHPWYARNRHVLPGSQGKIYVYMMRRGVLVVADERIPYYEVLMGDGGSVQGL